VSSRECLPRPFFLKFALAEINSFSGGSLSYSDGAKHTRSFRIPFVFILEMRVLYEKAGSRWLKMLRSRNRISSERGALGAQPR